MLMQCVSLMERKRNEPSGVSLPARKVPGHSPSDSRVPALSRSKAARRLINAGVLFVFMCRFTSMPSAGLLVAE